MSNGFNEAPEGADVAVKAGRRGSTYTDVHDWVTFSDVEPEAKALYVVLRAHVNRMRADDLVWTSTLALARVMTYSRGDKITKFIRQLEGIRAIDVDRNNVHGRMVFIVNQEPPEDYDGPLTAGEWHKRNKDELDRIRADEKAKRDARRARAKEKKESGSSDSVHPDQGEQGDEGSVHPDRGGQRHPDQGDVRPPVSGREPDVLEPDVPEPKNPLADATAAEASQSMQTTIDGHDEPLKKERTEAQIVRDTAAAIARWWFEGWKKLGTPIMGDTAEAKLRALVGASLRSGYTDDELRQALRAYRTPSVPSADRLQRELAAVRGVGIPSARSGGSGRVNAHWNQPEMALAGATTETPAAPKAAGIRTEGAHW